MSGLDPEFCSALRRRYKTEYGFPLLVADVRGAVVSGRVPETACSCGGRSDARRLEAARHTLRWGETVMNLCCDDGLAMWAVPLMHNAEVTGALVVQGVDLEDKGPGRTTAKVRRAAEGLLELAVRENLTNAAALLEAREGAMRERDRFLAIEAAKERWVLDDLRGIYLREEPGLLLAIKEGDNREARSILNRILTGIYAVADERLDLLKSCILELVVMMSRAAVEAGAEPALTLGTNYRSLSELAEIEDEEDLAPWVRRMLELLIESIRRSDSFPHSLLLNKALAHMRENLQEPLRRDEVARRAGVSPGHFSKLMTERMGRSFSELLTQMRVARAKEFMLQTDKSLTAIAMDCGFFDQSHLSKQFRKATGLSPGGYRRQHKPEGP